MDIRIQQINATEIKEFFDKEWEVINKKYNLLPPKETFFFGVYVDKNLSAYAKVELRGGVVEIRDILVKNELTGKGIGTNLLKYIEKWANDNNCKKSVIKVPSVFVDTIRFYEKSGYKKDAVLLDYYYNHDWYYMSKEF
ncbi:MAG: GNAT family N-acetyltransferase [Patescibacteria group bacterium]|nr:GNAT family N-acetyltransferase [Patescibacteria group bacterium]MDD5121477.1 GNAT family N-acetyltransferase [Patescibacteria group bacterium]MDD5221949.1 GNAT family N-acetyltransferase [Patescibacteria group bacterium]MDD5396361.1 GNAT family N-acetyltransferase [Patescibacteria group bacterium]